MAYVKSFLLGDHLGSTSLVVDASGNVFSEAKYKPFGEKRFQSVTPLPTDFQFTGQRYEASTGLYDYVARMYDPITGHFISADTVFDGWDRYAYVRNNPIRYSDPSGHIRCEEDNPKCGEKTNGGKNSTYQQESNGGRKASRETSHEKEQEVIVIVVCGWGAGGVCINDTANYGSYSNGFYSGTPFSDVKVWAAGKGYHFKAFEDADGIEKGITKPGIGDDIARLIDRMPNANFIIMGHSAGADAAIYGVQQAIKQGNGKQVQDLVLIDPGGAFEDRQGNVVETDTVAQNIGNALGDPILILSGDQTAGGANNNYGQSPNTQINAPGLDHYSVVNHTMSLLYKKFGEYWK